MAAAENEVFIGLQYGNCYLVGVDWGEGVGGIRFGERESTGGIFPSAGGNEQIYGWWGNFPHRPR